MTIDSAKDLQMNIAKEGFADVKQRLKKYEASKATLCCLTEQWFPHMSPISQI